jgi:hypothetical protein
MPLAPLPVRGGAARSLDAGVHGVSSLRNKASDVGPAVQDR